MSSHNRELLDLLKKELSSRDSTPINLHGRAHRMNHPDLSKIFIAAFDYANDQIKEGLDQDEFYPIVLIQFTLNAANAGFDDEDILRYVESLDEDEE